MENLNQLNNMNRTPQPADRLRASDELFPVEAVQMDSPRLRWMKQHGLVTWYTAVDGKDEDEFGQPMGPWTCTDIDENGPRLNWAGTGDTEEEACLHYARKHQLKLWNEEQFPNR